MPVGVASDGPAGIQPTIHAIATSAHAVTATEATTTEAMIAGCARAAAISPLMRPLPGPRAD